MFVTQKTTNMVGSVQGSRSYDRSMSNIDQKKQWRGWAFLSHLQNRLVYPWVQGMGVSTGRSLDIGDWNCREFSAASVRQFWLNSRNTVARKIGNHVQIGRRKLWSSKCKERHVVYPSLGQMMISLKAMLSTLKKNGHGVLVELNMMKKQGEEVDSEKETQQWLQFCKSIIEFSICRLVYLHKGSTLMPFRF